MAGNDVEERVMAVVARVFHRERSELSRDTRFLEDLHARSLNIVELTAVLENEFDIEIPGGDARRNKTIGQAVDYIAALLARKAAAQTSP